MLKASLAKGVLEIQLTLIQLYTSNLNAIGTQAALIAGFAFTGIAETPYPNDNFDDEVIEYFYYFFITVTLVSGLFAVSQAVCGTLRLFVCFVHSIVIHSQHRIHITSLVGVGD
mgnify:FL=1